MDHIYIYIDLDFFKFLLSLFIYSVPISYFLRSSLAVGAPLSIILYWVLNY